MQRLCAPRAAGTSGRLGASLARAEMAEALPILARRMPGLRLDGEVEWRADTGIVGPERLPLAFDPT